MPSTAMKTAPLEAIPIHDCGYYCRCSSVCNRDYSKKSLQIHFYQSLPLAPPDAGTLANYAFWCRCVATYALLTPGGLSIFQSLLPELKITRTSATVLCILAGITSGAAAFAASLLIGFPVPFTLIVGIPGWFAAMVPPTVVMYFARFRHDRALFRRFIRCWLILVWLALSLIIYPLYVFGFHRLGSLLQVGYISIFPLIKILGRNVISWLVGDCYDVKAGLVIFNVEVCSSLYMSVALENSAKITTTLTAIVVDMIQSIVTVSDVGKLMTGINRIIFSAGSRTSTSSSFRMMLINKPIPVVSSPRQRSVSQLPSPMDIGVLRSQTNQIPPRVVRIHPTNDGPIRTWEQNYDSTSGVVTVKPTSEIVRCDSLAPVTAQSYLSYKDQKRFVVKSARVLFTAEFVLLVKYVEAIVPAIYVTFVAIATNLGHRRYYNQVEGMTSENLNSIVFNIILYCFVKILSFCVLCVALSRKMGISSIHLVAFVLIHQWKVVLSRIVLWVVYTTLTSLKHSGPDFTFRFEWLHRSPST